MATPSYRVDPFDLRLFSAVVESGRIGGGAAAVNLSPAAASERLQALEHALGVVLLVRSRNGAQPTDAGRALLRHAHKVLHELDGLYAEMAPYARGMRGTVRVAANTAAVSEHLPAALGRFLALHPDIDVELRELWSHEVLEALRQGQVEIGLCADTVDASGLDTQPWRDDRLVLMTPRPPAAERPRFADVLDEPFVGLAADSGLSRFLHAQASRCGKRMHHRVRVRGFDAVAQLVRAGVGVAVVPECAALRFAAAGVGVQPLADDWATRRLLLCRRIGPAPSASAAALIAALTA
jgi:DNA-binding transcriptional LysR family regulator